MIEETKNKLFNELLLFKHSVKNLITEEEYPQLKNTRLEVDKISENIEDRIENAIKSKSTDQVIRVLNEIIFILKEQVRISHVGKTVLRTLTEGDIKLRYPTLDDKMMKYLDSIGIEYPPQKQGDIDVWMTAVSREGLNNTISKKIIAPASDLIARFTELKKILPEEKNLSPMGFALYLFFKSDFNGPYKSSPKWNNVLKEFNVDGFKPSTIGTYYTNLKGGQGYRTEEIEDAKQYAMQFEDNETLEKLREVKN